MLPMELSADYRDMMAASAEGDEKLLPFVKAADKLSALIKCIEERKSGNGEFRQAEKTIYKAVENLKMPEVQFFMEEFLPSYQLTLDEQD